MIIAPDHDRQLQHESSDEGGRQQIENGAHLDHDEMEVEDDLNESEFYESPRQPMMNYQ